MENNENSNNNQNPNPSDGIGQKLVFFVVAIILLVGAKFFIGF